MTPVEALECVMTARSADWVDDAGVFHDRLRALGFTVVPIEPTDEQVRQVRALPEIMAALEELVEAEYGVAAARRNRANQPDEYNRSMDRHDAAIEHLSELYERLK